MDFDIDSQASAIDDSFFPITSTPASAGIPNEKIEGGPWNTGPRSGQWTISSTTNGSGIDDRTPTIVRFPAQSDSGSVSGAKRIPGNVLRKLAAATETERRVKEAAAEKAIAESDADKKEQQERANSHEVEQGFFVPKLDGSRGIRIRSREGKGEVVRQPPPKLVARPDATVKKRQTQHPAADKPHSPSSVKSVAAASSTTTNKRTSNRIRIVGKNGEESFVELPFIPRTSKPACTKSVQKEVAQAATTTPAAPPTSGSAEDAKAKVERDATAEKEAKPLRDERLAAEAAVKKEAERLRTKKRAAEVAEKKKAEKLREEKLAAEPMMHGALPASSKAPSVAKSVKPSRSSSKASEQQVPKVFDVVSKPASIASSTTTVAKAASMQQQNSSQEDVRKASGARSKPTTIAGWQEVGFGTYEPATSGRRNVNQAKATPQPVARTPPKQASPPVSAGRRSSHSFNNFSGQWCPSRSATNQSSHRNPRNSQNAYGYGGQYTTEVGPDNGHGWSHTSAQTYDSFPIAFPPPSNHSYPQLQQQSSGGFGPAVQGPTIFAGRGWISPHPLSEAPTWAREEPDPVIQLPSGAALRTESGVETMTYEEWLAVQNQTDSHTARTGSRAASSKVHTVVSSANNRSGRSESGGNGGGRRNFSLTESHASRQYAGGNWAFRGQGNDRPSNYRTPTVRTESAAGSSQRHSLRRSNVSGDVAAQEVRDEDGNAKVQLPMPWDDPPSRQVSVSSSDALFF